MSFVILTDGTSNLGRDLREKFNIDYIPYVITSDKDGKDYVATLDWDAFSPKEYYDRMRDGDYFRTTQVQIVSYEEKFEQFLKEGHDILSISLSSALSGSFNASCLARESVLERYPDRKIRCVDTLNAAGGQGLIVLQAAQMKDEGKSLEEIADWIEKNRLCFHQLGTVDDMVYLKRSGRISSFKHVMSKILNIKPIIVSNSKGENVSLTTAKGRKNAWNKIIELTKENVIEPEKQMLFIVHGDDIERSEELKEEILKVVPFKEVYITAMNPTVGATTGPGTQGIYFFGKEVTF
ncbi:MAG: DegV family protein [Firmicutes bacterium]|nr:DegV family protein [Bacillota bacterium]